MRSTVKEIEIPDIGKVTIYRRKTARNLSLAISADNKIRVTIPYWASFRAGEDFVKSRKGWITLRKQPTKALVEGQQIGKAHRLRFVKTTSAKTSARIRGTEIFVAMPSDISHSDPEPQHYARKGALKALTAEAEHLLPQRLESIATTHNFSYASVKIKKMKGRWGSCSSKKEIVLNCFLMQLPWELIDYVIIHELSHTKHMSHNKDFWAEVAKYISNPKATKATMKQYQPTI